MQSDARDVRNPVVRVAFYDSEGEVVYDAAHGASDDVPVVPVGSPGTDALPLVIATVDGRTALFESATAEAAREVVECVGTGDLPTDAASSVVEHDPGVDDFPVPDGPLAVGVRRTLAGAGWVRPTSLAGNPLVSADSDPIARVDRVGLLGRGWGDARQDEPVAGSWRTARDADGDPVVVVNGTDADPRADADRLLLGSLPLRVLEGALAIAGATGATDVVVALPENDPVVAGRVRDAADAVSAETGRDVEVAAVPGSYMAGEPTAVLEALEGADRIEARRRPPGPDEHGLFERPTVVHTPRTLAAVRTLLADPGGFDVDSADPGTRLLTVHGETRRTVELPTDATIAAALPESVERTPSFACVGGEFGGLTTDIDVPASAPALAGAGLGTNGALEPFGEDDCAVAVAGRRVRFAREENCGRCVPCRAGSVQAHEKLRDVYDGEFDATRLRELSRTMRNTSLCGFGRDAARPLATALDRFETDLRAHADGRCPAGVCSP
ncbi:NADH dehydrogenase FAD-containing subunit [Halorarum halophilum]|uniref:NADH dehydrogenase FAD-containing subunit n=1 Tax=Halorarum halophilum TaxID=2743090 RepID=A0A7D5GAS8_9EURY|nr:NADH-ubiquinone oxidoreductase-F iron-sulfur binding region domain-containing protein [Halobaculum halophilum]QLG26705.1 NADH dehydrogenase FAD-containing subunit [Halobaculum halophilum]